VNDKQGPYVLGIDCGTQSLRSAVFDLQGNMLGVATQECPVTFPRVSWAEQDAADWWKAARATVPEALAAAKVRPDDIAGISVDGTSCTVVAAKRDGTPLRPVILWMDQRAYEQAAAVTATEDPVLKYVSGQESPEWMIPKALWLRENEPHIYEEADLIIEGTDWLMFKLTGNWVASQNNATAKWNYVSCEGGWPLSLLEKLDAGELRDKWPTEVLPMGRQAGELTAPAAEDLGLKPGIPVAEGGIDAYAAMFGVGAIYSGRMALVMGTSTCHMAVYDKPLFNTHVWGPYPDALLPGTWVLEGGQTATGSIVTWLADNFGYREELQATERGVDRFAVLDEKAAAVPAGAEGLVLLDYWQGNRSPLRDPLARGVVYGLSLRHTIGHLLRAIYEGTAMGSRHILQDLKQAGYEPTGIYACGGGTRSRLWLQIHADVCQVPLYVTQQPEATVLGTAICAAVGAGLFDTAAEAVEQMVTIKREILPDPARRETYDWLFDKYVRTYPQLKDLMHEVARRQL